MQKVGVIGLGSIGQRHLSNLRQLFPAAELYAVSASGNNSTISESNVLLVSITELITYKPDFVIIASPASLHLQHSQLVLTANIPVLIEKPLCVSVKEAEQFLTLSQQYPDSIIGVGYCLRYLESALAIQQLLKSTIGQVYNVIAQVGQFLPHWRPKKNYRQSVSAQAKLGGGALLELSHELDYLQWLLGPLKLSFAHNRKSGLLDLNVEDISDLILQSCEGICCYLHLDFIQQEANRHCSFLGTDGRLDWDLIANRITLHQHNKQTLIYDAPEYDKNDMYLQMIKAFCHKVTTADNDKSELRSAVNIIQLIEQIKLQYPMVAI